MHEILFLQGTEAKPNMNIIFPNIIVYSPTK